MPNKEPHSNELYSYQGYVLSENRSKVTKIDLYFCLRCAALVLDQPMHNSWHSSLV